MGNIMSVTMMDEIKVYVSKIPKSQITCSPKLLIKNISKHFSQTGLFTRTPEMIEKYHGDEIRELQNSLLLEFGMDKYEVRCICCGALFQDCDCPHSKCAVESCFLLDKCDVMSPCCGLWWHSKCLVKSGIRKMTSLSEYVDPEWKISYYHCGRNNDACPPPLNPWTGKECLKHDDEKPNPLDAYYSLATCHWCLGCLSEVVSLIRRRIKDVDEEKIMKYFVYIDERRWGHTSLKLVNLFRDTETGKLCTNRKIGSSRVFGTPSTPTLFPPRFSKDDFERVIFKEMRPNYVEKYFDHRRHFSPMYIYENTEKYRWFQYYTTIRDVVFKFDNNDGFSYFVLYQTRNNSLQYLVHQNATPFARGIVPRHLGVGQKMHYFNVDTEKWDIEDSDITLFPFEDTYPFVLMSKDTQLVHPTVKGSREWKYLDQMTILPTYDTPCVKCKTRRRRKLKNSDKRVKISSPSDGYYRYDIVCNECSEKDQSEKGSEDMEVEVPNPFQPEIPVAQGKPIESKKTQTRRTRKVRDRNSFIIESINSIIASFSEHTVCLLIIIHIKKFCKDEKISKLVKDASLRLKPLLEKLDNDLLSDEVTSVLFNLSQALIYNDYQSARTIYSTLEQNNWEKLGGSQILGVKRLVEILSRKRFNVHETDEGNQLIQYHKFRVQIEKIISEGNTEELTSRKVRVLLEKQFELEKGELDKQKNLINDLLTDILMEHEEKSRKLDEEDLSETIHDEVETPEEPPSPKYLSESKLVELLRKRSQPTHNPDINHVEMEVPKPKKGKTEEKTEAMVEAKIDETKENKKSQTAKKTNRALVQYRNKFFNEFHTRVCTLDLSRGEFHILVHDDETFGVSAIINAYSFQSYAYIVPQDLEKFDIKLFCKKTGISKKRVVRISLSDFVDINHKASFSGIYLEYFSVFEMQNDLQMLFLMEALKCECNIGILVRQEYDSDIKSVLETLLKRYTNQFIKSFSIIHHEKYTNEEYSEYWEYFYIKIVEICCY